MIVYHDAYTGDRISSKASNLDWRKKVQIGNTEGKLIESSTVKELGFNESISFTEGQIISLDYVAMSSTAQTMEESDAIWDEMFATSQDYLDKLANEIEAKYLAGLTEDFDPDNDPDLQ